MRIISYCLGIVCLLFFNSCSQERDLVPHYFSIEDGNYSTIKQGFQRVNNGEARLFLSSQSVYPNFTTNNLNGRGNYMDMSIQLAQDQDFIPPGTYLFEGANPTSADHVISLKACFGCDNMVTPPIAGDCYDIEDGFINIEKDNEQYTVTGTVRMTTGEKITISYQGTLFYI